MGKVIISMGGGGGGVSSEELTATSPYVLEGLTYSGSDTNDEIGEGTMKDRRVIDPAIGAYSSAWPNAPIHKGTSQSIAETVGSKEKLFSILAPEGYYKASRVGIPASELGNADQPNVVEGTSFTSEKGLKKQGTMPDNSLITNGTDTAPGFSTNYPKVPTRQGGNLQIATDTGGVKRVNIGVPAGYWPGPNSAYVSRPASDLGNAAAAHVLDGYSFSSANGIKVSGSMTNRGAVSKALNCGESYSVPAGYHNGGGKVTANSLASQTTGNITNARVLSGYVGWSNGVQYKGSIPSLAGGTYSASTTSRTISCKGKYMTSDIVINATNVQSILSFNFASRSYSKANFKWQNPATGPFYGIMIRGKSGSYPANVSDGNLIYNGSGTNKNASGTSYSNLVTCGTGNWYFRAYSYMLLDGTPVYHSTNKTATAQFTCYDCNECTDCSRCSSNCTSYCKGDCTSYCGDCSCFEPGQCPSDCDDCSDCTSNCNDCNQCSDYCYHESYPSSCIGNNY